MGLSFFAALSDFLASVRSFLLPFGFGCKFVYAEKIESNGSNRRVTESAYEINSEQTKGFDGDKHGSFHRASFDIWNTVGPGGTHCGMFQYFQSTSRRKSNMILACC